MVLAFCRRGVVIPLFVYLLVGRYMNQYWSWNERMARRHRSHERG